MLAMRGVDDALGYWWAQNFISILEVVMISIW